jgi:hypothetical protein
MNRLSLLCKNDVFLNSFALLQTIIEFLQTSKDDELKEELGKIKYCKDQEAGK